MHKSQINTEEIIDLSNFLPKPHPAKAVFQKHGIRHATVARYLGLNTPYLCNMLNGNYRMSKRVEEKIDLLVRSLEGGAVEGVG